MAEESIGDGQQECGHATCGCRVPLGQKFCSDYCATPDEAETNALRGSASCKCGHPGCGGES